MKKLLLIAGYVLMAFISQGQISNNDPYKMSEQFYHTVGGNTKAVIVKNKVEKVIWAERRFDSKKIQDWETDTLEIMTFNREGLPLHFISQDEHPVVVQKEAKANKSEYYFEYDTKNNLIKMLHISQDRFSSSILKYCKYFFYDSIGRLYAEMQADSILYPHGFKYRGVHYPNDILSETWYTICYDKRNRVRQIKLVYDECDERGMRFDTFNMNMSFDSAMIHDPGMYIDKLDSDGSVKETVYFRYTKDTDSYIRYKYIYDDRKRLIKTDIFDKNWNYTGAFIRKYLNNDLKDVEYSEGSKFYYKYQYEYFEK